MARTSTLKYDRGTLVLHPQPKGRAWVEDVTWEDRVEKFRLPALHNRRFLEAMNREGIEVKDEAKAVSTLEPNLV